MVERIRQLMEYKGFTSTQLADNIEVPRAIVSHILSGRNKPSLDVMLKIMSCYREVAVDWLLLGEGEMLKGLASESKQSTASSTERGSLPDASAEVQKEPELLKKVQEPTPVARQAQEAGKAIEQVMVFYTDKTFISYKPGS